jgi:hypothetical protein
MKGTCCCTSAFSLHLLSLIEKYRFNSTLDIDIISTTNSPCTHPLTLIIHGDVDTTVPPVIDTHAFTFTFFFRCIMDSKHRSGSYFLFQTFGEQVALGLRSCGFFLEAVGYQHNDIPLGPYGPFADKIAAFFDFSKEFGRDLE